MYKYENKDFLLAEKYVSACLDMDNLYRRKTSDNEASFSSEGLIPVILDERKGLGLSSWEDIKVTLSELYDGYLNIANDIRRNYMIEQISSIISLGEWCFEGIEGRYRNLTEKLLFVDPNPINSLQMKKIHEMLDAKLTNLGYRGSLEEKIKTWKNERLVNKNDLEDVLNSLVKKAKEDTLNFGLLDIEEKDVKAKVVFDAAYSGYMDYHGGQMNINGDISFAYEELKHIVTHETYPGHAAHMKIRENEVRSGNIPADGTLVFTNTASSSIFEGIGDNGAKFLSWYKTEHDDVADILQIIKSTASYLGAHMLHEEKKSVEEVKDMFRTYAFMDENAIDSKLRFISHKLRKAFINTYYRGNEAVYQTYMKVKKEEMPSFINYLYRNMHSANTIRQFNSLYW